MFHDHDQGPKTMFDDSEIGNEGDYSKSKLLDVWRMMKFRNIVGFGLHTQALARLQ